MRQEILSTGIDIGTSTTQLIFSKIIIENLANDYSVPRINIVSKEVVYRSSIYTTPIINQVEIDADKVKSIIQGEYQQAGYQPADLSTGAVIITGETARKKNANEVLKALSDMAGDFVVATAGPDLESVLAAKGAGTDKISKDHSGLIANVDIGGGTSNIAVYQRGVLLATACLDIGGRLIKIENNKVVYVFEKIARLAKRHGIDISAGEDADLSKLRRITALMAEQIAQAVNLSEEKEPDNFIHTNDGKRLPDALQIEGITFSGGVADCVYQDMADPFVFHDIGVLLGEAIKENPAFKKVQRYQAVETIRATVVGAGTHTTTVSGSTISYADSRLPVKNIPVLKVSAEDERDETRFIETIIRKIPMYCSEGEIDQLAIAFEGESFSTYDDIEKLTRSLLTGAKQIVESEFPLIVVIEKDIAKVLGNSLAIATDMKKEVICLDGIYASDGDYIDIGEPLAQGNVVPVIIKTLIFNS